MTEPIDVVDLLLEDHQVLRGLLARLDAADRPSELRNVYLLLVAELATHEAAEEEVVFPAFRAASPSGAKEALDRMGEHEEVNELVEEMLRLPPSGHAFTKRACALVLDLTAHLDAEEELVFPILRDVLSREQLVDLVGRVASAKELAPAFHDHHAAAL